MVVLSVGERLVERGLKTITAAHCRVYEKGIDTGRRTHVDVARFVPTSTGYKHVGMVAATEEKEPS